MALDFACTDWAERLERGAPPIADLALDRRRADRAVGVFDMLRLPDVPGQPPLAEAAGDWVRAIVRAVFGSEKRTAQGIERGVGEVFVLVPKKNSKTTSSAALALVFMLLNERRNADLLIIGPTQKIADTAFAQAAGMIQADPEGFLQDRFHVRDHLRTIVDRVTGARLMIRTFGMDVLTGCKPIFCLIDEVHILGSKAGAEDVLRQVRGGMLPFPESLLVMITTQSDHPPAGVFRSELQYARGVRDGRVAGAEVRTLPVLYEFPEEMQRDDAQPWREPETWAMVTPNLGRSITLDRLVSAYKRAEADGPQELIAWATQHLNVEVGMALHAERWVGADYWQATADPALSLAALIERSEVAVVGADVGGADDLFGLSVIGRESGSRRWLTWSTAWCTSAALAQRKEIAPLLRDLEAAGEVTITETAHAHVAAAADICERLRDADLLPDARAIGLDPWGVAALVDELLTRGFAEDQIMGVGQGYKLSGAIKGLERRLFDGTLAHSDQALMRWCVANAKAELRGNNVFITKERAGTAKIDALVALFNAAMLMDLNPAAAGGVPTPWDLDPGYRMTA
jgi:phage terminase large subunit-like protein